MTIVEFLTARLDEDRIGLTLMPEPTQIFDRSFDRQHLLADIAAKRRIIARCGQRHMVDVRTVGDLARDPHPNDFVPGELKNPFDAVVLRFMAEVYADHPDYDPRWRP